VSAITAVVNRVVHNAAHFHPFRFSRRTARRVTRCDRHRRCGDHGSPRRNATIALAIILLSLELILASPAAAAPNLASVVVRGSTVYDAPQLFEVYRQQLGKPVTVAGARAIAAALATKYQRDGYSRPQIRLDDSLLEVGVLRFEVLEPRIAEVRVTGDPGPHLERLESLGERLRDDGPISQTEIDATLRNMRSLPGLSLRATTERDAVSTHLYRLDLDADFKRTTGTVRLSNRGTDEAGPYFMLGQVLVNGLFGGRTNLGAMFGAATDYDEYHGLGLVANRGVGMTGGRLALTGFRSRSDPHEPVTDRDDTYLRDRGSLTFIRPLADVERVALTLRAGLDLDDLEIVRSGERLRDERLRMLALGATASWRQSDATQHSASLELSHGLDAFGSGLAASDLGADPRSAEFLVSRLTFTRLTRFGERWSLRLDALGQQTAYTLPYGERFKIGGDRLGRGFEVAEIAGDRGIGAKIEGRRTLTRAPALLQRASLYGFYDIGAAWKNDAPGRESAATTGAGFETRGRRLSGTLELAKPLTHPDVEGRKELTLFAEIAVSL
jgi:hemolysin activation/secretion protein